MRTPLLVRSLVSARSLLSALLATVVLALFQLVAPLLGLPAPPLLDSLRVSGAVILFCAYLVYNTQLMMGGSKKRQLRPDEHLMAAVAIYTDIVNLFLHLVQIMARRDE